MGYADLAASTALTAFEHDYRTKTALNRKILDHLLHDAFGDDAKTEPEVDLVLDPDPPAGADRGSAGPLSVSRRAAGLSKPDGPIDREDPRSCRRAAAGTFWPRSRRDC